MKTEGGRRAKKGLREGGGSGSERSWNWDVWIPPAGITLTAGGAQRFEFLCLQEGLRGRGGDDECLEKFWGMLKQTDVGTASSSRISAPTSWWTATFAVVALIFTASFATVWMLLLIQKLTFLFSV